MYSYQLPSISSNSSSDILVAHSSAAAVSDVLRFYPAALSKNTVAAGIARPARAIAPFCVGVGRGNGIV